MYTLSTPVTAIKGIGPTTAAKLTDKNIATVADILLQVPLRYEDRSQLVTIAQATLDTLITIKATVQKISVFRRPGRLITTVTIADNTGKLKLSWFNVSFISSSLKEGEEYFFSGKISSKYGSMSHPAFEKVSETTIHTNRLVPIYSSQLPFPQGKWRKLLFGITGQLQPEADLLEQVAAAHNISTLPLDQALKALHFPEQLDTVVQARERLALEEFILLTRLAHQLKATRKIQANATNIKLLKVGEGTKPYIPTSVPFELTTAQSKALAEIFADLQSSVPMNRLLVGDVGSGKTIVAGLAALQMIKNGKHAYIVAPTKVLAGQHVQTLRKLLPQMMCELITSSKDTALKAAQPTLFVGTHALLPTIEAQQPGLIVYDEQHRFGVEQRSTAIQDDYSPHVLTMSATPIPRSLMLTIFSHLDLSVIDAPPRGRKPVTTWLIPDHKKEKSWQWIAQTIQKTQSQVFVVCPFIDPSSNDQLEDVQAATAYFEELSSKLVGTKLRLGLLHGRQKAAQQQTVIQELYSHQLDILVCTPMVEVGIDVPQASIIVIEGAERFGLASLHQLRGRVGRAGQESWCLVCPSPGREDTDRLRQFCTENSGFKLAEKDLENRGAGDLFGTRQSGLDVLRFGTWTNAVLIDQARSISDHLPDNWHSVLKINVEGSGGGN